MGFSRTRESLRAKQRCVTACKPCKRLVNSCKQRGGIEESSKFRSVLKLVFAGLLLLRLSYLYGKNTEHHKNWLQTRSQVTHTRNCSAVNAVLPDEEALKIQKEKYTIVVSTYNRDNELIKNVDHWLSCPHVHEVQIVWHNPLRDLPDLLVDVEKEHNCSTPRLVIRKQKEDQLSNRFRTPAKAFATDAVFNIDDDAVLDCRLMTQAFMQWRKLGEDALVGFEPRQIDWTDETGQGYQWWASCTEDDCKYNTLWPTKGAFLHRKFYKLYWSKTYGSVRKLVDTYFTGEDILMTFVHFHHYYAKHKKAPPILSVQAVSDFTRNYLDKTDRFSPLQKLAHLPEVIFYKTGIAEATSLGARSSWYRARVTGAIGKLAQKIASPQVIPPMIDHWYFVNSDGLNGFFVKLPCAKPELFQSLTCSTKVSLTVLNTTDAELLCLLIVLLSFSCCYACYLIQQHRAETHAFEEIRARKVSAASPLEAELRSIPVEV
mmetsp:Transcript_15227/g.17246  ORF Transcript_15227/g.17246 Transcript_15227/m.17246 type:complete len:488 (+) Transcript_15227:246-1709(+)